MVIFRRPDGKPGYHQADGVDDAVRFVEMLRNQEQVTDSRIFRMEEVPFEFRPVYRVEIVGQDGAKPAAKVVAAKAVAAKTAAAGPADAAPAVAEPAPEIDDGLPDIPTPGEAASVAKARSRFHRN